jgi:Histidine kinase-, DNA gyrase B-, and HSP90-like ATPase
MAIRSIHCWVGKHRKICVAHRSKFECPTSQMGRFQSFKINMERSLDPAAGKIDVFPQEIARALLNLISNGFYAATKRKEQDNSNGYEPTLVASTKNLGDDNGIGISPEIREKMFNPFFTTKPAGEGTGLGLSITHDIIVKRHLGSIEVDTQPGEYTEVRIVLPRTAAFIAEFFYGPGTWYTREDDIGDQVRQQQVPIIGEGQGVYSFVHIDDAAGATAAALECPPGAYNIVDGNPSPQHLWLRAFARAAGAPPPPRVSQEEALRASGADAVYYATRLRGASNEKAGRELEFRPRPLELI